MEAQATTHDTAAAEAQPILEPVIIETEAEKAARAYFERWPNTEQIVLIKKVAGNTATVTVVDRDAGPRITVQLPADDSLEGGSQGLAARFSNARTEFVYY